MKYLTLVFFLMVYTFSAYTDSSPEAPYDSYVENYKPRLLSFSLSVPFDLTEEQLIQNQLQAQEAKSAVLMFQQKAIPWTLLEFFFLFAIFFSLYIFKPSVFTKAFKKEELIPPRKKALDKLQELQRRNLPAQNKLAEYYFELKKLLDEYLDAQYHVPALTKTPEELIKDPAFQKLILDHNSSWLGEWMLKANRIIYGSHPIPVSECKEDFDQIQAFLNTLIFDQRVNYLSLKGAGFWN